MYLVGEADHKGSCGQGEDSGFSSEKTGESLYCFEQKNDIICLIFYKYFLLLY